MPTLAELHLTARERGVPHYRRLAKAELEAALEGAPVVPGAPVRLERDGPLALIVLDDPGSRNVLGPAAMAAFEAIVDELAADTDARLVAVTGAGGVFSSGAAIREHDVMADGGAILTDRGNALLDRLAALPVPIVALVNGHAVGGGAELALACDWRLMAPDAELRFVHATIGLVPGFGGLGRLRQILGPAGALRMLATHEAVNGRRALQIGLADEVVPPSDLRSRARSMAGRIAGTDRGAIAAAKLALAVGTREAERDAFLACWPNRKIPTNARG